MFTPEDYEKKAVELLKNFTANERGMVSFGIFPHDKMTAAEKEGYTLHPLVVALMKENRTSAR